MYNTVRVCYTYVSGDGCIHGLTRAPRICCAMVHRLEGGREVVGAVLTTPSALFWVDDKGFDSAVVPTCFLRSVCLHRSSAAFSDVN